MHILRRSVIVMALGATGATLGTGCSSDDAVEGSDWSQIEESASAIQGGVTSHEDVAVVGMAIVQGGSIGGCTGSLIAPNLVLTAQHCVSNLSSPQVVCGSPTFESTISASSFYVSTETQLSPQSEFIGVREIIVPPNGTDVCGFDVALMILDGVVEGVEPLVPRVDVDVVLNESYRAVGFGATGQQGGGSFTRRKLDGLELKCAGADCGGSVQATEWLGDTGICQGDSGGPALDGQNRVIGVVSRGGYNCSKPVYGSVYAWREWIVETAQAAALEGGYPPPSWAEPTSAPEGQGGASAVDGEGGGGGGVEEDDHSGHDHASDHDSDDHHDDDHGCSMSAPVPSGRTEHALLMLGLALTLGFRNRLSRKSGDRR